MITAEVRCFYSVSSGMKCPSEDSFESCLSTFDKAPHTSSAVFFDCGTEMPCVLDGGR